MKIALDATPLTVATGGIQTYTRQLHRALTVEFPCESFELLAPKPGRWWSFGLPRELARAGFDLFHGTDFAVPYLSTVPTVMTVHDLSPWEPVYKSETSNRVRRRTPWLLRLGRANMVITPTEAIRREAIEYFRLDPASVRAVPHGVDERFRPTQGDPPDRPYLLAVGTQGLRKNMKMAVMAAWEAGIELWIAGRGVEWPSVRGVRNLGAVPDDELPTLYSHATAFLFPSLYEGFGLPLLEAMACGAPVVASRDPALTEVAGGAAQHCDLDDPKKWAEAIGNAQLQRAEIARRGQARAAEFTWSNTARLTRDVYREAACRHAGH
jgi:glycosyltransferase involved in cell wall biosynthesis